MVSLLLVHRYIVDRRYSVSLELCRLKFIAFRFIAFAIFSLFVYALRLFDNRRA